MNRDRQVILSEGVRVEVIDAELATPVEHTKAIAKQRTLDDCDEPFFVGDLSAVASQFRRWRSRLPRVEPFYAVKCNDDMAVLRTLAELGAGFDCASKAELRRVLQLGVPPSRIIYANPCKQASMIRYARAMNVDMMTFDNVDELHKIKEHYPEAKMVLRILPQAVKAQCVLGNKFGAPYASVARLIQAAKSLMVDVVGVSFHVGSGCQDAQGYAFALQLARRVFDDLIAADFRPYLLDVGGGFPGTEDDVLQFDEIVDVLLPSLDELFPASSGVQVIAEPGRYMVTRAFTLMANVIGKRVPNGTTDAEDAAQCSSSEPSTSTSSSAQAANTHISYYINDGVYGSFNCLFFDHCTVRPRVAKRIANDAPRYPSSLYGPTCDGLDCVMKDVTLPELLIGDWVYFEHMGAYTMVSASEFNGMPLAARFYTVNKSDAMLFRRELATAFVENGNALSHELTSVVGEAFIDELRNVAASMQERDATLADVNVAYHQLETSGASQSTFGGELDGSQSQYNAVRDELKSVLREIHEQAESLDANGDAAAIAKLETFLNSIAISGDDAQSDAFGDAQGESFANEAEQIAAKRASREKGESAKSTSDADETMSTYSETAHQSDSTVGEPEMGLVDDMQIVIVDF